MLISLEAVVCVFEEQEDRLGTVHGIRYLTEVGAW